METDGDCTLHEDLVKTNSRKTIITPWFVPPQTSFSNSLSRSKIGLPTKT
jgi:hypothetical protein